jgi:undecaprenyl-diphosphatase
MSISDAVILGLIQGLTEFLPISSSGHLVISKALLGFKTPGVTLEIWLHFGTLAAVLVYFRRKISILMQSLFRLRDGGGTENRTLLLALVIGTIPAVVIGITLKPFIESFFAKPAFAAVMLLVTGLILLVTRHAKNRALKVSMGRGFVVGAAQAAAILPGLSRSGSTIACAMFLGVEPALAAEFSFLLAIPAIGGAFLLDLVSSGAALFESGQFFLYLLGALVSFIFGFLSIHYLLKIIRRGRFFYFGFYCLVIGGVSLIYLR